MHCYCTTIVRNGYIEEDGQNQTDSRPCFICPHCHGSIDNGTNSPEQNEAMSRTHGGGVRIINGTYYFSTLYVTKSLSVFDGLSRQFSMAILDQVIPRPIWLHRCRKECKNRRRGIRTLCRFECQQKRTAHSHRQFWGRLYNSIESSTNNNNQN
jgi:hypothetical protein